MRVRRILVIARRPDRVESGVELERDRAERKTCPIPICSPAWKT